MTVISDTSPISYPVPTGRKEVIPELYGDFLIPGAVDRELVPPGDPEAVRERISGSSSWLKVQTSSLECRELRPGQKQQEGLQDLDPGEREAILLAMREEGKLLLYDEGGR